MLNFKPLHLESVNFFRANTGFYLRGGGGTKKTKKVFWVVSKKVSPVPSKKSLWGGRDPLMYDVFAFVNFYTDYT